MVLLSLGDFLWSLLVIFFMVTYFMMFFQVVVDLFHRPETSGTTKVLWFLFLLFVPLLGLIIYMITNAEGMAQRNLQQAQRSRAQMDEYVRETAGSGSAADIAKAKELLDSGAINQAEFDQLKSKALVG